MHVDIRPFEPTDQQAARALILAGLSERWGTIDESANPDLDDIEGFYGSGNFFVGFLDGELFATGGLIPESDSTVRIARMWVAKRLRRAGVGSQMIEYLLNLAPRRRFRKIVLETTDAWQDAILFYSKHGFRICDRRDGDFHFVINLTRDGLSLR